jgi:hypothetical protein
MKECGKSLHGKKKRCTVHNLKCLCSAIVAQFRMAFFRETYHKKKNEHEMRSLMTNKCAEWDGQEHALATQGSFFC